MDVFGTQRRLDDDDDVFVLHSARYQSRDTGTAGAAPWNNVGTLLLLLLLPVMMMLMMPIQTQRSLQSAATSNNAELVSPTEPRAVWQSLPTRAEPGPRDELAVPAGRLLTVAGLYTPAEIPPHSAARDIDNGLFTNQWSSRSNRSSVCRPMSACVRTETLSSLI